MTEADNPLTGTMKVSGRKVDIEHPNEIGAILNIKDGFLSERMTWEEIRERVDIDKECYDYYKPTDWVNLGDANPDPHGGLFTKWDGGMWKIVQTIHGDMRPDDYMGENHHEVNVYYLEPSDVWVKGNPANGFTNDFRGGLEQSHSTGFHIGQADNDPTAMKFALEECFHDILMEIAHGTPMKQHSRPNFIRPNVEYWDYLENRFGITEESI